jgi:hypothetical protein
MTEIRACCPTSDNGPHVPSCEQYVPPQGRQVVDVTFPGRFYGKQPAAPTLSQPECPCGCGLNHEATRGGLDPHAEIVPTPAYGTEDYRIHACLFNDISRVELPHADLLFADRLALQEYLWAQGWRREVRPEDVTG